MTDPRRNATYAADRECHLTWTHPFGTVHWQQQQNPQGTHFWKSLLHGSGAAKLLKKLGFSWPHLKGYFSLVTLTLQ